MLKTTNEWGLTLDYQTARYLRTYLNGANIAKLIIGNRKIKTCEVFV